MSRGRGELRAEPETSARTANDDTEDLWGAKRAAKYLDVSPSWVYQRMDSGELPWCPVGGLKKLEPAVVRAFARGQIVAVTPPVVLGRKPESKE